MKRSAVVFCIMSLVGALGFAWDWPVTDGLVVGGLGPAPDDEVLPGIVIGATDALVRASASGELVFAFDGDLPYHGPPSVLGSVMVLHHERGFRTVYGHLDGRPNLDGSFEAGSPLARVGQSGAALGRRLFFQVLDTEREVAVNPLLLLPIVAEDPPPTIQSLDLVPTHETQGGADRVRILVAATDRLSMNGRQSQVFPYSIELFIDGQLQFSFTMDSLGVDAGDGNWITGSGRLVSQLLDDEGRIDLGEYAVVPGITELEVVVTDPQGNSANRVVSVPGGRSPSGEEP
jgi:hypothetical protein